MEEPKFLKKHIKTGAIDVHPTEKALIVNYELEATILGEEGDPMFGEKKTCQKIIRLKDLSEQTDISALAKELVDKCKLIPPNKLPEIEQLLYYLQNRRDVGDTSNGSFKSRKTKVANNDGPSTADFNQIGADLTDRANIHSLEKYIEMIYENVSEKVKGTSLILQLARNPDNLEELLQNETLLGALARVLREEWKKSMDLTTNIVYVFFCFSTFTQFHAMISHFKVGALCVQIVEYEVTRYDMWRDDLQPKAKNNNDAEKSQRKLQMLIKKQEQLLRVSLYLLLNLAEDENTEAKMANRGIVEMLCQMLERVECSIEFHILILTFLRKLSVYKENVTKMAKQKVVEKVTKILGNVKSEDFVDVALRLLLNLSFDTELRGKMSTSNLIPLIAPYIAVPTHRPVALSLLYHISMDDQSKAVFTYTDCIPTCMRLLFESDGEPQIELLALLINMALNKRNAQMIAGDKGQGLKLLMEIGFRQQNSMIIKLLRNVSSHDGELKAYFVEYVGDLANAAKKIDKNKVDFGIECLGILNQLNVPDLDFGALLTEFNLVEWIFTKIESGTTDDDIVLEVIVLLGTVAADENGAKLLMDSGIVDKLINILSAKQEDDEIVLQIVFVFYQMMFHDSLRKKLLTETKVPLYLIELMHDKNSQIRRMCDNTLDVIAEHGEEWAKKIQEEKFRWHNTQWLEMVGGGQTSTGTINNDNYALDDDEDDDDLLNNGLDQSDIFNDLYGVQTQDIVNSYGSDDRPISRIGHRNAVDADQRPQPTLDDEDEEDEDDDDPLNSSDTSDRNVRYR